MTYAMNNVIRAAETLPLNLRRALRFVDLQDAANEQFGGINPANMADLPGHLKRIAELRLKYDG